MLQQTNPTAAAPPSMMGSWEPWPYRPQAACRPEATPLGLQHHSIIVMPATAHENMMLTHCGAAGRLSKFVSNLPLQLLARLHLVEVSASYAYNAHEHAQGGPGMALAMEHKDFKQR
jgi:hypothetical protein